MAKSSYLLAEDPPLEELLLADVPPETERRFAWVLTGSGHFLRESLDLALALPAVDFFLSRAAEEVLPMYGWTLKALREKLAGRGWLVRDSSHSSAPVGLLYRGFYHTVVVAPATSNTVAKCVWGISDTLATNMYAQAGKCRVENLVFACDSEPVVVTDAPNGRVVLYPRAVDLDNTAKLRAHEGTTVVTTPDELSAALAQRQACLNRSLACSS
jgi:dihydromethanopterin reductase (acceptor)